jgi:galactonate dehydratase
MQISALRHFLVHPTAGKNLLFVALDTDGGLTGWGECYTQSDRDLQIVAHLDQLERYVVGRDPSQIKHFTDVMYNDFAARRGAMDYYSAISGIEQAMWDLQGQRLGAPVHELLGGRVRDRIRVYANGWARRGTHEELAASARAIVDRGFTAMKFDPVPGPWRTFISREQEREAIERVRVVREAVGPDTEILVEIHRRLAPMHAVRIARGVEEFAPYWFEEPVLAENIEALAAARREINIPVVTGEELYTKHEFRAVFEQQAADIINPDVCNVGGILELKEIAAMAEPYFVAVSPHNYNSTTLGLAATLQVAATIPNFVITEYFVNLEPLGREIADLPFEVEDSYIRVPDRSGIGIALDEEALARHAYEPFPQRHITTTAEEGP